MRCRIDYRVDGTPGHTNVIAPTSIDAVLIWLATLPEHARVQVIVRAVRPVEIAQ